MFCSREEGESPETDQFLAQVRGYGLPLYTYSFDRHRREAGAKGMGFGRSGFAPWRQAYDREVLKRIGGIPVDAALQAGYMLIWTPELCRRVRALNLHPAEPGGPAGTWQQVIWQLIERRAATSGVYLHLVTPELDEGPVVSFCRYRIDGPEFVEAWRAVAGRSIDDLKAEEGEGLPLFRQIREAGVKRELPLIVATLQALGDGALTLLPTGPGDAAGHPASALDLSGPIEAQLSPIPQS